MKTMLNMSCKICSVDYDSTMHNLYPRVLEKSCKQPEKHVLFRLLMELGSSGNCILAQLTSFMEERDKQHLLCWCMESFSPELTELLNRKLHENDMGKCFSIGALMPDSEGGSIVLAARNTIVDYSSFMEQIRRRTPGGFFGQALLRLINSVIENGDADQKIVKATDNTIVQTLIKDMLSSALHKQGICVEIDHISIQMAENDTLLPDAAKPLLDRRTESILIKALAEYLRHTAPEDETSIIASV